MPTNKTIENYRKPAGKMSPRIVLVSIVGALLATTSLAQANGEARKESLSLLQAPYSRHSPPAVPSLMSQADAESLEQTVLGRNNWLVAETMNFIAWGYYFRGEELECLKQHEKSIDDYSKVISLHPKEAGQ